MVKKLKNPVARDTRIEGDVPRRQLPDPPKNFTWYLKSYRQKRYRIYKREIEKIRYTYVITPVAFFEIGRRKYWYKYITRGGRRRRQYFIRQRVYYVDYIIRKVKRPYTYTTKWWILKKKIKPPKVEDWVDTTEFVNKKLKQFGLDPDEVEIEKMPPFDHTERQYQFNFYRKALPIGYIYDLIFLYYVISVYKLKEQRHVLVTSSFDLNGDYDFSHIVKKFVPLAIKQTRARIKRAQESGREIKFVGYICFGAVKKRTLEEGKRS